MASTAMTRVTMRIGELDIELNAEVLGVKSALPQVADVALQFAEGHLLRLQGFFFEILRRLVDFWKAFDVELAETADRFAVEPALPSMSQRSTAAIAVPNERWRQRCGGKGRSSPG